MPDKNIGSLAAIQHKQSLGKRGQIVSLWNSLARDIVQCCGK